MRLDSRQLKIMKAITTVLEGINPANVDPSDDGGALYTIDLTGCVIRGRTQFGKEQKSPFIGILESPQPLPVIGVGYDEKIVRKESWQLLVQGFIDDDKAHPSDNAYWFKGLVEERLSRIVSVDPDTGDGRDPALYMLNFAGALGLDCITIGQGIVRPPDTSVSASCFFYIPLAIDFISDVSKPFSV